MTSGAAPVQLTARERERAPGKRMSTMRAEGLGGIALPVGAAVIWRSLIRVNVLRIADT